MKTLSLPSTGFLLAACLAGASLIASPSPVVVPLKAAVMPPVPISVVKPLGVPRDFVDSTVEVIMTIDVDGHPRDLAPGRGVTGLLAKRLFPAMTQWRFTPAQRDGQAVPLRILLPVKLVCAN